MQLQKCNKGFGTLYYTSLYFHNYSESKKLLCKLLSDTSHIVRGLLNLNYQKANNEINVFLFEICLYCKNPFHTAKKYRTQHIK